MLSSDSSRGAIARGRRLGVLLLALVPALVAGAQIASLLFFLNPALPLALLPAMRAALYLSALFAPLSLAVHLVVARWRRVEIERLAPWSLTVVMAFAALGFAVHASVDAYLLPEAMNGQLIKSALWSALGAVLLFYTALLHTLHHKRYGVRSRLLVALVALGALVIPYDRRANFRPAASTASAVATAPDLATTPSLVVIALPTATLDAILPLARQGKLPFFAQLLDEGASVRLVSVSPPRSATLWTSWATGKLPYRHAITTGARYSSPLFDGETRLGLLPILPVFSRWGLAGGARLRLSPADRTALAAWEIFARLGRRAVAAGFPVWLGGEGPHDRGTRGDLSLAARELRGAGFERFARELESDRSRLADARTRWLAGGARQDALFIELPGLERPALASYGAFAAVNFEGARSAATTNAARAYETMLGGLDAELSLFAADLPPGSLLAISSPYGVTAPRSLRRLARLIRSSDLELSGTLGSGADGLLLLRGPGVRAGVRIAEARLEDLVPTLLYATGLPIARDFDGRVLAEIFEPAVLQERALSFVPTFEGERAPR